MIMMIKMTTMMIKVRRTMIILTSWNQYGGDKDDDEDYQQEDGDSDSDDQNQEDGDQDENEEKVHLLKCKNGDNRDQVDDYDGEQGFHLLAETNPCLSKLFHQNFLSLLPLQVGMIRGG